MVKGTNTHTCVHVYSTYIHIHTHVLDTMHVFSENIHVTEVELVDRDNVSAMWGTQGTGGVRKWVGIYVYVYLHLSLSLCTISIDIINTYGEYMDR